MTIIRVSLTIRNGTFSTVHTNHQGVTSLKAINHSIVKLIQLDSSMLPDGIVRRTLTMATFSGKKNVMKSDMGIPAKCQVSTGGVIDSLTHLVNAEAIAELEPGDKRKPLLRRINRALAGKDLCADITIDDVEVPPLDHLSFASMATIDTEWHGHTILRVTSWNVETHNIDGRNDEFDLINVDLRHAPKMFHDLAHRQPPFLKVVEGHGRINPIGLRILRCGSLIGLDHNQLPTTLKLHVTGSADDIGE